MVQRAGENCLRPDQLNKDSGSGSSRHMEVWADECVGCLYAHLPVNSHEQIFLTLSNKVNNHRLFSAYEQHQKWAIKCKNGGNQNAKHPWEVKAGCVRICSQIIQSTSRKSFPDV